MDISIEKEKEKETVKCWETQLIESIKICVWTPSLDHPPKQFSLQFGTI